MSLLKYIVTIVFSICMIIKADSQQPPPYTIDATALHAPIQTGHLQLGSNKNPAGEVLSANSLYFTKNGKPWFPVMGEFHFSRFPKEQWESSILKMKMAGIDIIATYIFWIYHEEEEGEWDWSGNNDLRQFAALCAKHQVYLFVRIGPWCHGEVRNGGFPDWLLTKPFKPRTNDSTYLAYAGKLFSQIHRQIEGLYFKTGGPVIGAQIENEFRFNNPRGLEHITTLKQMAVKAGIDVPFYTATGWPGSDIKQRELLPVWGAYPEAPWNKSTSTIPLSENYLFQTLRSDPSIGNDLLGDTKDATNFKGYPYPYATAEMGAGIQITYHRRPIIEPDDVTAMAYVKAGSGANLVGYYMFHGGSNTLGKLSTLQESKASKYPNDYPIINYDFQSPIGQWGQLRPSYRAFKLLHYFLNDFGEQLADDYAYFPAEPPAGATDTAHLRWSVRSDTNSGFIFVNNFQRQLVMPGKDRVQFNIQLNKEKVQVPIRPFTIPAGAQMIFPFHLRLHTALLRYATVQPLCKLQNNKTTTMVFFAHPGVRAEYLLDTTNITTISATNAMVAKRGGQYIVSVTTPGTNCFVRLRLSDGTYTELLTLTRQQALDSWRITTNGIQRIAISEAELTVTGSRIALKSTGKAAATLAIYPAVKKITIGNGALKTINVAKGFSTHPVTFATRRPKVQWEQQATPLVSTTDSVFNGLPLYQPQLKAVPGATYWKVKVPANIMNGLSNALLHIYYQGDTQAAYVDNQLVTDDFYSGAPMMIGLNQLKGISGKQLDLLVTPLNDSSKIYFEKGIRTPLAGKSVATINRIEVVPQYKTVIRID